MNHETLASRAQFSDSRRIAGHDLRTQATRFGIDIALLTHRKQM